MRKGNCEHKIQIVKIVKGQRQQVCAGCGKSMGVLK